MNKLVWRGSVRMACGEKRDKGKCKSPGRGHSSSRGLWERLATWIYSRVGLSAGRCNTLAAGCMWLVQLGKVSSKDIVWKWQRRHASVATSSVVSRLRATCQTALISSASLFPHWLLMFFHPPLFSYLPVFVLASNRFFFPGSANAPLPHCCTPK